MKNNSKYDVVVAGAGYAGLAFAMEGARLGLKILVLDKKKFAGENPHTTGIIVKEAADKWNFPDYFTHKLTRVKIFSPSLKKLELYSPDYYFLTADTPALLQWMEKEAAAAGVQFLWDHPVKNVQGGANVVLPDYGVEAKFYIGADGPRSKSARLFGLSPNTKFLYGIEAELPSGAVNISNDSMYCFLDAKIAPGYLGWIVPGPKVIQAGLASHKVHKAHLHAFFEKLAEPFGLKKEDIIMKKGGPIPAGGLRKKWWRGNVLLIGDAAGIVSPLTAGGIHTALESGKTAARLVAGHLFSGAQHPAIVMQKELPRFFWKKKLRFLMEHLPANWMYNTALSTSLFTRFAEIIYFHNRGLFSKDAWIDLIQKNRQ